MSAAEASKGVMGILRELRGLGFASSEAQLYFSLSQKLPRGVRKDFDMSKARRVLDEVLLYQSDPELALKAPGLLQDQESVVVAQELLSEIWRWRRRGGGSEEEENPESLSPHQRALKDIQSMEKVDIDRITSSVLDSLPISDQQKYEMSSTVQKAAMGGINGAVWGSLVMGVIALLGFNFLRSSS